MKHHQDDPFFSARLFSKRRALTVQEKETALKQVMAEIRPSKKRRFEWARAFRGWRVAAAVAVVLLALPVVFMVVTKEAAPPEFAPRGPRDTLFQIKCIKNGKAASCTKGARLVFRVHPPEEMPYFAAFAKHQATGTVVWYFPADETTSSIHLGRTSPSDVLSKGIRIGDEHPSGAYVVHGIFTTTPMSRQRIRDDWNEGMKRMGDTDAGHVASRPLFIETPK